MTATAEHVAIAELIVYIPIALLAIFVVIRHGFYKQLGWIYLCIFSGIRVAGSIMEIRSVRDPDNTDDKEWATILQSFGLSPLLLSTLGLLKRVFDETTTRVPSDPLSPRNVILQCVGLFSGIFGVVGKLLSIYNKKATAVSYRSKVVQLLHIPALIALILAISGGSDEADDFSSSDGASSGRGEVRAAVVLFCLIYAATCLLWVITVRDVGRMQTSQKRIFFCVFLALPLIAVRLLYSLISDFGHNPQFALLSGDITIQIVMATVEEFAVVCLYTLLGLVTPKSSIAPAVGGGIIPQQLMSPLTPTEEAGRERRRHKYASHTEAGSPYAPDQHC